MRVIDIFDDVAGGHHPRFVAGLVRETQQRGNHCLVACPHLDEAVAELPEVTWMQTTPGTLRRPMGGYRTLKAVAGTWGRTFPDAFWDLYLDKNVWVLPRKLRAVATRIHVLHAVNQYRTEDRGLLGMARTTYLRRRIERLAHDGAVIVVHTRRAFDVLAEFLPADQLLRIGYPVETHDPIPSQRSDNDLRLLFVGGARREKGLFELLDAMEVLRQTMTLDILGPQPPGLRDLVTSKHPTLDIRWTDRFVTDMELREAFHRCHLVALAYLPSFGARGGASAVLLQALSEGAPFLTTPSLAGQLPDAYGGAVIAESHLPNALADALAGATDRLTALTTSASVDGPAFTRAFHSYERYVDTLFRVGARGR